MRAFALLCVLVMLCGILLAGCVITQRVTKECRDSLAFPGSVDLPLPGLPRRVRGVPVRKHGLRARRKRGIKIMVEKEVVFSMWAARVHRQARAGDIIVSTPLGTMEVIGVNAVKRTVKLRPLTRERIEDLIRQGMA